MAQANADMQEFWNRQGGPTWVAHEPVFDTFLAPVEALLRAAARPQPGERVLDVGCGFGTTALAMAAAVGPTGSVLGVDLSDAMVARTLERAGAAGLAQLNAVTADAQTAVLAADAFDLAISRMGVMFFEQPAAAFTNIHASMRAGGRLAFACWQRRDANEWVSVVGRAATAAAGIVFPPEAGGPGPFAFGDPGVVRPLLDAAGWREVVIDGYDVSLQMGGPAGGLEDAVLQATRSSELRRLMEPLDDQRRDAIVAAVRAALAPYTVDGRVVVGGALWIVTARS
jgi:SAM-dependent methyltransferase